MIIFLLFILNCFCVLIGIVLNQKLICYKEFNASERLERIK